MVFQEGNNMTNIDDKQNHVNKQAVKKNRSLSLRKLSFHIGISLGAIVLAVALLILVFAGPIINHYGKAKAELAFKETYPGYELKIGELDYTIGANRLIAKSVNIDATNFNFKAGQIKLEGVKWLRLLWGKPTLADLLAKADLDAANLDMEFPLAHYGISSTRLRASVPSSELTIEGTELRLLIGDGAYLAEHTFRTTRYHIVIPECKVSGLEYDELFHGKSYQAKSVHFSESILDALVSRDKMPEPDVKSPLMVHEALASIQKPLRIDSLIITNGQVKYSERLTAGSNPGVMTFGAVNMSIEGITNRGETNAAIQLRAQGDIMNAGTLKLLMSIPITPPNFSLHYSGSLSAMDMTRLNAFLEIAEQTRIKSGRTQEIEFEIDVNAGQARGLVHATYRDLVISVLHKQIGNEKGRVNSIASFLAKVFKIRKSNTLEKLGPMKEGKVNYKRRPDDTFLQFAWFSLRSGVLDVISH